jgi:hypothetical protein
MTIQEAIDRAAARARRWEASQARDEAILSAALWMPSPVVAVKYGVSEHFVEQLLRASGRK